jgi:hypothetical protein
MKITQAVEEIERSNLGSEQGFRIQANRRAFQILSSNLYADKITAVIRELSCNAWDSHVAAGKTNIPFEVHLPNMLEPYFSVQDYGLGLSHDQVMNIYTTYFESTKTHTNDLIGGLGLGSKSPFSYTNSFDVVSVYNGVCRNYAMFINEAGKPSVAFMGDSPTTAPNGVRVNMPVKSTDFKAFNVKAAQVFKWFSHPPKVSGDSRFEIPTIKINLDIQGISWRLQESSYSSYNSNAVALMGNVAYPLKTSVIKPKFHKLLEWPLIIDFKIGELDISASREDLSYDSVTVQIIETKLAYIFNDLENRIQDKFKEADTLWEARLLMSVISKDRSLSDILYVMRRSGFKPMWRGQEVSQDIIVWDKLFKSVDPNDPASTPQHAPLVYNVSHWRKARNVAMIKPTTSTVFVLRDVNDAAARCKKYYENKSSSAEVYLIGTVDNSDPTKCPQIARLLKHIGDPPTILASSMDKILREKRTKRAVVTGHRWTGRSNYWRPRKADNWGGAADINVNDGAYYVTMKALDPIYINDGKTDLDLSLDNIIKNAKILGLFDEAGVVWGINKTETRIINNKPGWINIYEFVEKKLNELVANSNIAQIVSDNKQLSVLEINFHSTSTCWMKMFGQHNNSLGEFVRAWDNVKSMKNKLDLNALSMLVNIYQIKIDTNFGNQINLIDLWNQAIKDYPMLVKFAHDITESNHWSLLVDYVNMVDAYNKCSTN